MRSALMPVRLRRMKSASSISAEDVMGLETGMSTFAADVSSGELSGRSSSMRIFIFDAAWDVTIGAMAQVTSITSTVPFSMVSPIMRVPSGMIMLYPMVTTARATAVCAVVRTNIMRLSALSIRYAIWAIQAAIH